MLTRLNPLSKSNLYGRLLLLMLLMMFTLILASESYFLLGNDSDGPKYGGVIYCIFQMIFWLYVVWLLKTLDYSRILIIGMIFYAVLGLIVGLYVSNPFLDVVSDENRPLVYSICHYILLLSEVGLAVVILKDIFGSDNTRPDHIWGAIVVYFLITLVFSEVYEIITLSRPGLLGRVYEIGWPNYVHCGMFSLNSITGVDMLYPESHLLLRKLGTLENVMGNLFLVVILGRLLSNPLQK